MRVLIMLSLFLLPLSAFAHATPAMAGDQSIDAIHQTWTASPMPNGGTAYSNGLDFVEVSPSGPSRSSYHGWTRDGRETSGTIYTAPRYDQPREPSLTERVQRYDRYAGPAPYCRVSCVDRR